MNEENMQQFGGQSAFAFSGVNIDSLGSTEYTLVVIALDVTGSVTYFANSIRNCLMTVVETCSDPKKSPNRLKLMLRVILFSSSLPNGIEELHGFKLVTEIDTNSYPQLNPGGLTPLFDATYSAINSVISFGERLAASDYGVNAIVFIVTDGEDNRSTMTPSSIKMLGEKVEENIKAEVPGLESLISILVGVNAADCRTSLERFKDEAKLTHFLEIEDASPAKFAKLADFVSQSISSQSQSLGTGGPSQAIALSI